MSHPDELLRHHAIQALGPLGEPLARLVLEHGEVFLDAVIVAWEGSSGTVHGYRVIVVVDAELRGRVLASLDSEGALIAALSAALARRPGHSLAELRLEPGAKAAGAPYR